jgi:hypothetical protein
MFVEKPFAILSFLQTIKKRTVLTVRLSLCSIKQLPMRVYVETEL